MAALVESSGEAIIGATLEGVITSWNPAAEKLFGYTSKEMIGQWGTVVRRPEDRSREHPEVLEKVKAGHSVDNLETVRLRKDGTARGCSPHSSWNCWRAPVSILAKRRFVWCVLASPAAPRPIQSSSRVR